MDDLTYSYNSGNQLLKVADAAIIDGFGFKDDALNTTADTANDYTYDANGNLKSDANKSISAIQYNYLNLPTQVTINGQNILYVYDALGTRLKKTVNTTTTDYAGNFIYENGGLQFFNQPEGYVEISSPPSGELEGAYVYQYKDHLGNIRLSYKDISTTSTPSLQIVEENNYYPFGLKHKGYNANINGTHHKYMFGGKELSEELGLNTYDFGARNYDAALGRWMNLDPLAELMTEYSPYNYAFDNPIYYRDKNGRLPTGMLDPYLIFDGSKNKIYIYDDNNTPDDPSDDVLLGTFDAHNNVILNSQGKWEDGTYKMYDKNLPHTHSTMEKWRGKFIKEDSPNGKFGTRGIYRVANFIQTDRKFRTAMGIHAGREYKPFFDRKTNGCIRTTDECMKAIGNAIEQYGALTSITVKNNKETMNPMPTVMPINIPNVIPIQPFSPKPIDPLPIIIPPITPNPPKTLPFDPSQLPVFRT